MKSALMALIFLLICTGPVVAEDRIKVQGDYPVVEELGKGSFEPDEKKDTPPLIPYTSGVDYREKALAEALHFLSANVYGYSFVYKPGSVLMKSEESFAVELRGFLGPQSATVIGEGVEDGIYRVKLEFEVTPSVRRWQNAFHSSTLRLLDSEGTSDFYAGWEGRGAALHDALRNLVLIAARRSLSSRPLLLRGDILLKGTPEFSVGAGRHFCAVSGYVNFVEIVTYD
jgi:hypothetical protein